MSVALHYNTGVHSILEMNRIIRSKRSQSLDLATIRFTRDHLSNSWYTEGVLEVDVLGGPVVGPPRIFHEQCFTAFGIRNNPASCATTINVETVEERVDVDEGIHFVSVVGCPSCQRSADFAFVFDSPLDASVEADIHLVWRAKPKDKSYEGMGVIVKVEGWSVLSPAPVKVKESQVVPSDNNHANKSSIGLLNE